MGERDRYQLGWDDGYAEGYGAKLVDLTEMFMPAGSAADVQAGAKYLMSQRADLAKVDAIGLVRGILRAMDPTPDRPQEQEGGE